MKEDKRLHHSEPATGYIKSWKTDTYKRYLQNLFKLEPVEHHARLKTSSEVFSIVIHNWDEDVMDSVKAYKTVVLDSCDRPLRSVYFEPNAPIDLDHIKTLFEVIRSQIDTAASVVICRNNASKPFLPDEQEKRVAASFRNYGKKVHIPVIDQFVVSSMGMYRFQTEDYLETTV
ncbi:JAB domain-containing protein [Mucilaginibacter sp. NFX135]|uniref:JAB domain-containing protein n=1 Tax=Mucilaginibacter sp. NFX135 TaxID=3402687 RepID=UPI003AFA4A4F